jgi:thymidylate synthase (FAD)
MKNILDVGHFSVLEHSTATFLFGGVSRSLSHEFIRSRHLSYSELSQRFENMEDAELVTPPAYYRHFPLDAMMAWRGKRFNEIKENYATVVDFLVGKGLTRKQAREAARADLPNATQTRIVVTGNFRAWRQFIAMRATIHADAEICAVAVEVLQNLQVHAPNVFGDFELSVWSGPGSDGRTYAHSSVSAPC